MKSEKDKKNKIMAAFITLASIIVLGGITFTFFSASVSNANNEKINTQTATMSLEFDDNDNGVSGTLNLGQSIIKKFTLENTGTVDAYGKINWYNLVNTYLPNSLTWTLEQSATENGTYTIVGSGSVPTSTTATTKVLKNGLLVPVNATYYYKLTITLNNLDIDQSSDISASMNSKFSLEKGSLTGADQIMNLVADANPASTDVITKTAPTGSSCTNTFAYDGTVDNNLRYVGGNPCNHIIFNNEIPSSRGYRWRIIGIMNNVDNGTGKKEPRIKIVRNPLGSSNKVYSWDTSDSSVNSGYGVNDWTGADLMQELNGDYLNLNLNANTMWYNGQNNTQTEAFDYTNRLGEAAQNQIENVKWHLGGLMDISSDLIVKNMYTKERETQVWGSTSGQICNDSSCPRKTEWVGKVGLIYPSDYGFATTGGNTISRNTCINSLSLYNTSDGNTWRNSSNSDCRTNNWLKQTNNSIWTITTISQRANEAFKINSGGYGAYSSTTHNPAFVLPVVYLKSDIKITGGDGSPDNPYTLG